jgi:hypothetical protein
MPYLQYFVKIALTAVTVVAVSELAKRSTLWGALLTSLPLTSALAFVWLYVDTGDTDRIARLSIEVLWLVVPSLLFFVALPALLRGGVGFWISMAVATVGTAIAYAATIALLARASRP